MSEGSLPRDRSRGLALMLSALAVAASFLVYPPSRDVPFDFLDFSEFLTLLQRGRSFAGRLHELVTYYAGQGRANVVAYVAIAAKWSIWGNSPVAWQWIRFLTMWLIIALTYVLLRRLQTRRFAALAGASLFLFAPPAVQGWTRLTMGEPVGTVLLLLACLLAISRHPRLSEPRVGLLFGLTCAGIVLLKEMMVVTLILPLALVAARESRGGPLWRVPRLRTLALAGFLATSVAMVPVAVVALRARADAFTGDFGVGLRPPGDIVAQWTLGLLPFGVDAFPTRLAGVALLAVLTIIGGGWALRLRGGDDSVSERGVRGERWLLATVVLFPLIGAVEYLPWPAYNSFYAIPFLLAGSLAAGLSLSAIETMKGELAPLAYGVWLLFLAVAGVDASAQSERVAARQRVNRALVDRLARLDPTVDTVFVATDLRPASVWQGIGPTLERYGEAVSGKMPIIVNAPCNETRVRAAARSEAAAFYSSLCPNPVSSNPLTERYRRLRFPHFVDDSLRVDVVIPSAIERRGAARAP